MAKVGLLVAAEMAAGSTAAGVLVAAEMAAAPTAAEVLVAAEMAVELMVEGGSAEGATAEEATGWP